MASVSGPNPTARYPEGAKPNKILSIAPIQMVMVRYVDPDGKESMVLCYVFGEAEYKELKNKRMAGVWTVANLQELQSKMKLARGDAATQILAQMEEKGLLRDGKVATSAPAQVELPDVSDIFSDLGDGEKKDETSGE